MTSQSDDWRNWPVVKGGQGRTDSSVAGAAGGTLVIIAVGISLIGIGFACSSRWISAAVCLLIAAGCMVVSFFCGLAELDAATRADDRHRTDIEA